MEHLSGIVGQLMMTDKEETLDKSSSMISPSQRNVVLFVILAIVAATIWYLARPAPLLVQGTVESVRIDIAARVNGRASVPVVERGQNVKANSVVARIDNPEIIAQLASAQAAQAVAEAELARIYAGTRSEVIDQLKSAVSSAEANHDLAQKTYDRINRLAGDGFSPKSRLDQATNALIVSSRTLEQAKLAYDQAVSGFTKEDIEIAKAAVAKAKADVAALQAQVDELTIHTPIDAQVFRIDIEQGEFVLAGVPLLSLSDVDNPYIVLSLREDLMSGLKIGQRVKFTLPALKHEIETEIRYIASRGEYSGWSSTRVTGDFDLRTFDVRFYPVTKIEGLRPGMSAYTQWTTGR